MTIVCNFGEALSLDKRTNRSNISEPKLSPGQYREVMFLSQFNTSFLNFTVAFPVRLQLYCLAHDSAKQKKSNFNYINVTDVNCSTGDHVFLIVPL